MSVISKFLGTAVLATMLATGAMAGGLGGAIVEGEPIAEEDPQGGLGVLGALALLLLLGGLAGSSSSSTTGGNNT